MRVVLDTNVLLSALISPHRALDMIYRAWRSARFELVTSDIQLDELKRVRRYPKLKAVLQPHRVGAVINNMQRALVLANLPPLPDDITVDDPYDIYLAAMSLAAGADYLVTGDRRAGLLTHGHIRRTRVVTPSTFCEMAL